MTGPHELSLVRLAVPRLKEALPAGTAETIRAVLQPPEKSQLRLPSIQVFLAEDEATPSDFPDLGAYQRVAATVGVLHELRAVNTSTGEAELDPMTDFTIATRKVLNGWGPLATDVVAEKLIFRRGELVDIADGKASWLDRYVISWRTVQVQDN